MILADYSDPVPNDPDRRIDAAAFRAAGFGGTIRYLRKRGPSGVAVLTTSEVQDFTRSSFPFAAVYEDGAAGWMLQGAATGRDRALWALRQARAVGFEPRCIYFADDGPRTTTADVEAVLACLAAARRALAEGGDLDGRHEPPARYGPDVAGIYSFRAVMSQVAARGLARYRWLTGSKPSPSTVVQLGLSAYQRNSGGPYAAAGVSVDASDTYTEDWGQLPPPDGGDMPLEDADLTQVENRVWGHDLQLGDGVEPAWRVLNDARSQAVAARDAANSAKSGVTAALASLSDLSEDVAGLSAKVAAVATGGVDLDALAAKVADLLAARLQS